MKRFQCEKGRSGQVMNFLYLSVALTSLYSYRYVQVPFFIFMVIQLAVGANGSIADLANRTQMMQTHNHLSHANIQVMICPYNYFTWQKVSSSKLTHCVEHLRWVVNRWLHPYDAWMQLCGLSAAFWCQRLDLTLLLPNSLPRAKDFLTPYFAGELR